MNWAGGFQNMFQNWSAERHQALQDQRDFDRQNKLEQSRMLKQQEMYRWTKQQESDAADQERGRLGQRADSLGLTGVEKERFIASGGQTIPQTDEEYDRETERAGRRETALGGIRTDQAIDQAKKISQLKRDEVKQNALAEADAKIAAQNTMLTEMGVDPKSQEGMEIKKELAGIKKKADNLSADKRADLLINAQKQAASMLENMDPDQVTMEFGSEANALGQITQMLYMQGVAAVQPKPQSESDVVKYLTALPDDQLEEKLGRIESEYGPARADKMRQKVEAARQKQESANLTAQEDMTALGGYSENAPRPKPEKPTDNTPWLNKWLSKINNWAKEQQKNQMPEPTYGTTGGY